jgi:ferric iron reductase protein FhuF
LFSEKSEVTITHQSTEDLREKLRSKLEKLVNPVEIDEAVVIEHEDLDEIDLDEELGSLDEEYDDEEYDDDEKN